jgi:hypothetical protein
MGSDFGSGTSLNYTNHTDPIFTAPPGIANGVILSLLFEIGGNPSPPATPPDGFELADGYPLTRSDSNGFTVRTYLWTKPANNEAGDYQVIHSNAPSTGFLWTVLGADVANPLLPLPTDQTGIGTTATAPGLTTTLDQTLIMGWVGRWNFPGGTFDAGGTTPTFTLRNDAANSLLYVASGVMSPQGATGDKVMTGLPQNPDEPWASGLIAFKTAEEDPEPEPQTLRPRRNMISPATTAIGIDLTQITTNPNKSDVFPIHDASRLTLEVQANQPASAGSWVIKAVPAPDNTIDGQILVTTNFPATPADVASETEEVAHMWGYVQQVTPIAGASLQRVIVYKQ